MKQRVTSGGARRRGHVPHRSRPPRRSRQVASASRDRAAPPGSRGRRARIRTGRCCTRAGSPQSLRACAEGRTGGGGRGEEEGGGSGERRARERYTSQRHILEHSAVGGTRAEHRVARGQGQGAGGARRIGRHMTRAPSADRPAPRTGRAGGAVARQRRGQGSGVRTRARVVPHAPAVLARRHGGGAAR